MFLEPWLCANFLKNQKCPFTNWSYCPHGEISASNFWTKSSTLEMSPKFEAAKISVSRKNQFLGPVAMAQGSTFSKSCTHKIFQINGRTFPCLPFGKCQCVVTSIFCKNVKTPNTLLEWGQWATFLKNEISHTLIHHKHLWTASLVSVGPKNDYWWRCSQKGDFHYFANLRCSGFWPDSYGTTLLFFQIMHLKNLLNSLANAFLSFIWKVSMCECMDLGSGWPKNAQMTHCGAQERGFLHDMSAGSGY